MVETRSQARRRKIEEEKEKEKEKLKPKTWLCNLCDVHIPIDAHHPCLLADMTQGKLVFHACLAEKRIIKVFRPSFWSNYFATEKCTFCNVFTMDMHDENNGFYIT